MTYKEIEQRDSSKFYFYDENNEMIAIVENDKLEILKEISDEDLEKIKTAASL